jgi:4-hydroxy-4-methyl-2-oxoglutarate aldolase
MTIPDADKKAIFKDNPRPDPAVSRALAKYGVAPVHESQSRADLLPPSIRPMYAGKSIAGPAVTVTSPPGDNWMIQVAGEVCKPGGIQEVAPSLLQAHGVQALIIDAGGRDVATLKEIHFPTWSKCVYALGTIQASLGSVIIPVICAAQAINPRRCERRGR